MNFTPVDIPKINFVFGVGKADRERGRATAAEVCAGTSYLKRILELLAEKNALMAEKRALKREIRRLKRQGRG